MWARPDPTLTSRFPSSRPADNGANVGAACTTTDAPADCANVGVCNANGVCDGLNCRDPNQCADKFESCREEGLLLWIVLPRHRRQQEVLPADVRRRTPLLPRLHLPKRHVRSGIVRRRRVHPELRERQRRLRRRVPRCQPGRCMPRTERQPKVQMQQSRRRDPVRVRQLPERIQVLHVHDAGVMAMSDPRSLAASFRVFSLFSTASAPTRGDAPRPNRPRHAESTMSSRRPHIRAPRAFVKERK